MHINENFPHQEKEKKKILLKVYLGLLYLEFSASDNDNIFASLISYG